MGPGARGHTLLQRCSANTHLANTHPPEFTNLSILNRWTWGLALADTAWGATACGVAAVVQLLLLRKLQG